MEKLKWIEAEYTIKELLKPGGGVVVQRDILEQWKADNPGQEIKAHAGFKCNQQDFTVSIRIGTVDKTNLANSGTMAKIEGNINVSDSSKPKLLRPGYDELKRNYDEITKALSFATNFNKRLQKQYDEVQHDLEIYKNQYDELRTGHDNLIKQYDALVAAVSKDAQKFSVTLTANDTLKEKVDELRLKCDQLRAGPYSECSHCVENEELKTANEQWKAKLEDLAEVTKTELARVDVENENLKKQLEAEHNLCLCPECKEDVADLADAKEVIKSADCPQVPLILPDSVPFAESVPTPDELANAAVKVAESNVTGGPLLAPRKEITQEEAKSKFNAADFQDVDLSLIEEDDVQV